MHKNNFHNRKAAAELSRAGAIASQASKLPVEACPNPRTCPVQKIQAKNRRKPLSHKDKSLVSSFVTALTRPDKTFSPVGNPKSPSPQIHGTMPLAIRSLPTTTQKSLVSQMRMTLTRLGKTLGRADLDSPGDN